MPGKVRAFVAVGSNLGDRQSNLEKARRQLAAAGGVHFLNFSPVYETEPVGGPPQGKFLNAVWEMETRLSASDLLQRLQVVEASLGRERTIPEGPRTIDLDLLFYGQDVIHKMGLTVPHPRLQERFFVLRPLADIAPDWVHPVLGKSVREMLEEIRAHHPSP